MSNILPKKSWHVYNDKNREKVKKDENSARIEKEKNDERAKAAEREHRLSILRSRANIELCISSKGDEKSSNKNSRFELFNSDDGFKDPIKSEFEKDLASIEAQNKSSYKSSKRKQPYPNANNIEADHDKNDPLSFSSDLRRKKNQKDYSFV